MQARSFSEMLKKTMNAYHNRAIATHEIIQELINLAKEMRDANQRGEERGLGDDEICFYDALAMNESEVQAMVEAGAAKTLMGNHEFLRPHTCKNKRQHHATLDQLTKKNEINDAIEWFRTLPMWLELDGVNVVHACWQPSHHAMINAAIKQYGGVTTKFMVEATDQGSDLYLAVDDVLKGKEIPLPDGVSYEDKDGNLRTDVRVKWFESPTGKTYRQYALPATERIPEVSVPNDYPWDKLAAEFLDWAQQSRRDSVFREYRRDLNKFAEFENVKSARQIDQQLVFGYRDWRLASGGVGSGLVSC